MPGMLDGVDRRTQLVGQNRLELLLFRMDQRQLFGINVFKVREVIACPPLTKVPSAHPAVRGIANIRGKTIAVVDLSMALGMAPAALDEENYVIVTEFSRTVQGFLVSGVERIVNLHWEQIQPPPRGADRNAYLTAVTQVDEHLVEIIDVEKVLSEVFGQDEEPIVPELSGPIVAGVHHVLVADDSSVARNQIRRSLEQAGVTCTVVRDGREALDQLKTWADEGPVAERIAMVISDIEMPEMDGYTLTAEMRQDPRLKDLYVMLHSSLSGVFNTSMVRKVGADEFLAKFDASELVEHVLQHMGGRREDEAGVRE